MFVQLVTISPALDISNCNYIVIKGWTLINCLGDATTGHLYLRNGTDNVEVKNLTVYRPGYAGESTSIIFSIITLNAPSDDREKDADF